MDFRESDSYESNNKGDLNQLKVPVTVRESTEQVDNSTNGRAFVNVYFKDLEEHLICNIQKYPIVIGCVAWLTNFRVLDTLATRDRVSLVVQKEDFLRPDLGEVSRWKEKLREKYNNLPTGVSDFYAGDIDWGLSLDGCSGLPLEEETRYFDAIRCVGRYNSQKSSSFPRMHNKFVVFCNLQTNDDDHFSYASLKIDPTAVWTGSFNFTQTSGRSLENAVLIEDSNIANAYYSEWKQIFKLSEDLDWSSEWVEPNLPLFYS
jgi:hypothetical protein